MRKTRADSFTLHHDQSGFASLVIGMILIVVATLLVVGYAQLARHEEGQALTKQLASQAYYAAETGINDVVAELNSVGGMNTVQTAAAAHPNGCIVNVPWLHEDISNSYGVQYTCVIVSLDANNLFYQIGRGEGKTAVVNITNANPLKIDWQSQTPAHNVYRNGSQNFPPANSWNNAPPVIQFSITPVGGTLSRNNLVSQTQNFFLYPSANGANTANLLGSQGRIVSGNCASGGCEVNLNGVNNGQYLIHIISLYDAANVTVKGGANSTFSGAQALIDVTGKAQNVLKRLQVRVPLGDRVDLANYAIEAQQMCKRIVSQTTGTIFLDINNTPTTSDPCGFSFNASQVSPAMAQVAPPPICVVNCGILRPGIYYWGLTRINASNNASRWVSCTWDYGDELYGGTPITYTDSAHCDFGAVIPIYVVKHPVPPMPFRQSYCGSLTYNITVTMHLADGQNPTSTASPAHLPYCANP